MRTEPRSASALVPQWLIGAQFDIQNRDNPYSIMKLAMLRRNTYPEGIKTS
jgi:hypothetical protein